MTYAGDTNNMLFMQDGSPNWWESPDITIPGDVAVTGSNPVTVVGRKNAPPPNTGNGLPSTKVKIEAYLATPGLQMFPPQPGGQYTYFIGSATVTIAQPTAAEVFNPPPMNLTIPNVEPADPNDPFHSGHRCLIGRIFPFGQVPPSGAFNPPGEQHECQHNMSVVVTANKQSGEQNAGGAGKGQAGTNAKKPLFLNLEGLLDFRVDTTTRLAKAEDVLITATWANLDPKIKRFAAELKRTRVFRGFARRPPAGFGFNVKLPLQDLPHAKGQKPYIPKVLEVKDNSKGKQPRYDALIRLQPKKPARIALNVNPEGSSTAGLAHVFYLEQHNKAGKPQGGITVIFVPMS